MNNTLRIRHKNIILVVNNLTGEVIRVEEPLKTKPLTDILLHNNWLTFWRRNDHRKFNNEKITQSSRNRINRAIRIYGSSRIDYDDNGIFIFLNVNRTI